MQRRAEDIATRSVTLEDLPQVFVTPADSNLFDNPFEVSSATPGQVEEKPTSEKDEATSTDNVMDTTFAKEGTVGQHGLIVCAASVDLFEVYFSDEESGIDPKTLGGDDSTDAIQD